MWTQPVEQLVELVRSMAMKESLYATHTGAQGLLAVILLGFICGSVGSLVVGNRMAFFSDALAHCAFAGVAIALIVGLVTGAETGEFSLWILSILVGFGIIVGLGIAFVQERTTQASDTVIGVFFAGAIGLGAIFLAAGSSRRMFPPEQFLFGGLATVQVSHLAVLIILSVVTMAALCWLYNRQVFASFSPSLSRARGVPIRLTNYAFIVLLAVIVNVCLMTVGVLLINGLLIVPAAAAANFARNMRQLFPLSVALCIISGIGGQWLSFEFQQRFNVPVGEAGVIVVIAVCFYFISVLTRRRA